MAAVPARDEAGQELEEQLVATGLEAGQASSPEDGLVSSRQQKAPGTACQRRAPWALGVASLLLALGILLARKPLSLTDQDGVAASSSFLEEKSGFVWMGLGEDTACAANPADKAAAEGISMWRVYEPSLANCMTRCEKEVGCTAVEFAKGSCALWKGVVNYVQEMKGYECHVRVPPGHYKRKPDSACRPSNVTDDSLRAGGETMVIDHVEEPTCRTLCRSALGVACYGTEYSSKHERCYIWRSPIGHTEHMAGVSCSIFDLPAELAGSRERAEADQTLDETEDCDYALCSMGTWAGKFLPWLLTSTTTTTTTLTSTSTKTTSTHRTSSTTTITTTEKLLEELPAKHPQNLSEECHTTQDGEECFKHVTWVRTYGIQWHPDWYPNLSKNSTSEEVQMLLHEQDTPRVRCPRPCKRVTLFCFTVVSEDGRVPPGGAVVPGYEKVLVDEQENLGLGVFACDSSRRYLGQRAQFGAWKSIANTKIFVDVWQQVKSDGLYLKNDWTVKADPDAVFFPQRLRSHLLKLDAPMDQPLYVKNIDFKFGFMGALETLNKLAADTFLQQQEKCLNMSKDDGGEDYFLKRCLDMLGVDHVEDVTILNDKYVLGPGWHLFDVSPCANTSVAAFHPYKAVTSWMVCHQVAEGTTRLDSLPECNFNSGGTACRVTKTTPPPAVSGEE